MGGVGRSRPRAGRLAAVTFHPPRLLFVCTANMNRSVTAAAWTQKWFSERFVSAEIQSAGTHAYDGAPAAASTIEAMFEHGFDLREHRTRRVSSALIAWADHVVLMEPMHLEVVRGLSPDAEDTFLPMWPFVGDGEGGHVVDPHGGPLEGYRAMASSLSDASKQLVAYVLAERRRRRRSQQ